MLRNVTLLVVVSLLMACSNTKFGKIDPLRTGFDGDYTKTRNIGELKLPGEFTLDNVDNYYFVEPVTEKESNQTALLLPPSRKGSL